MITALPMTTVVDAVPDPDLDTPHHAIRVTWTWPDKTQEAPSAPPGVPTPTPPTTYQEVYNQFARYRDVLDEFDSYYILLNQVQEVGKPSQAARSSSEVLWTRFRLVRRLYSPAVRVEEGAVLLDTTQEEWGDPTFEDRSIPPDRWVYYTAFVLDKNRVWIPVGDVYEMGIGDHDWSIKLPESLPGVSISTERQVVARADPDHELVEFLQAPALHLDRVVSYGESAQHFWDPRLVPPPALPALLDTLGFTYDDTLPDDRLREIAYALLQRNSAPGTLQKIRDFVEAATGYDAEVEVSNNKMMTVLDSSFEHVYIENTVMDYFKVLKLFPTYGGITPPDVPTYADLVQADKDFSDMVRELNWSPKDDQTLEVRRYSDPSATPNDALPIEVLDKHYLHIKKAATLRCGSPDVEQGGAIPVFLWDEARGGVFARSAGGVSTIRMALDLYGSDGVTRLRTVDLVPPTQTTQFWTFYSTPFDSPVPLDVSWSSDLHVGSAWRDVWVDRAQPQSPPVDANGAVKFTWNTDPNPTGQIVLQPQTAMMLAPVTGVPITPVTVSMDVAGNQHPDLDAAMTVTPWRMVVMLPGAKDLFFYSDWFDAGSDDETVSMEVTPQTSSLWFGIEVQRPPVTTNTYGRVLTRNATYGAVQTSYGDYQALVDDPAEGGWSTPTQHVVLSNHVRAKENAEGKSYWAVPVIQVSDNTDIDLVVVDDGVS